MPSDSLETLHDLFVHELRDLYDAENQLLKALPKMSEAAQSPELKRAFDNHLRETKQQVSRLEEVFNGLGESPKGKSCKAMQGLIAESNELLGEDANPDVMDAALIVAAQKVEHYEIASYGSVCTFGRILGLDDATEILKQTMAEEERADKLLTSIAEELNIEAEAGESGSEGSRAGQSGRAGQQGRGAQQRGGQESNADEESSPARGGGSRSGGNSRMRSGGGRQASGSNPRGTSSSRTKATGTRGRSTSRVQARSASRSRR